MASASDITITVNDLASRQLLAAAIVTFLAGRPEGATAREIAKALRRRLSDVLVVVKTSDLFSASAEEATPGRKRTVYRIAPRAAGGRGTPGNTTPVPTQCDRILARLRRGPATHHELYGLGCVVHSRISELRARGHVIPKADLVVREDGSRDYVYRLVVAPALEEREAA